MSKSSVFFKPVSLEIEKYVTGEIIHKFSNFIKEDKEVKEEKNIDWDKMAKRCEDREIENRDFETVWQFVAFACNKTVVEKYFDTHPEDLKAAHKSGKTPLHYAAWGGDLEVVKFFGAKQQWSTSKTKCGSPLHYAALAGSVPVMDYLVTDLKFDPNQRHPSNDYTLAHLAVESGKIEAVKKAHELGVNLNKKADHKTALELAKSLLSTPNEIIDYLSERTNDISHCCLIL